MTSSPVAAECPAWHLPKGLNSHDILVIDFVLPHPSRQQVSPSTTTHSTARHSHCYSASTVASQHHP
ncbi:hypothetical protein E2C01_021017 [Portunus trituberculatus]|uniref:Uncharacterized protein n=1 Tax=Portunus trituberculatus TaxID=210409 RepID=A0A5B7E1F1_PORTR|nr:hypothetical protein [Portunus trituberculatus]